jgi:hypothetical protein
MNRQVIRSPVARFLVAAGKLAPHVEKSAIPSSLSVGCTFWFLEKAHAVVCCSRNLNAGRLCRSVRCSRRETVNYNSFAPVDSSAHADPCAN